MKFSKNCGTSSYLKVDAVGSAGYEPRVLTAELMARTVVFYIIAEFSPLAKRYVPFSLHTMAVKGGVDSCGAGGSFGRFSCLSFTLQHRSGGGDIAVSPPSLSPIPRLCPRPPQSLQPASPTMPYGSAIWSGSR